MTKIPFKTSVGCQREVVQMRAELGIEEESRRSFPVANGIHALDRPRRRFGFVDSPGLALNPNPAFSHVLHPDLQAIPGIGFPGEWSLYGSRCFRFPRFDLQLLRRSVEHQRVALRGDADIPHLPAPFGRAD